MALKLAEPAHFPIQLREYPPALWSATLYYAQGLPFSLVRQLAVVFFKDQGVSLQALGLVSLYGLPWTLKFLWSPWIDTVGTRRRWVVVMQGALTVGVGGLTLAIARQARVQGVALGFLVVADESQLLEVVRRAIQSNPKAVADYKKGKLKAADAIKGAVMRETKGMAKTEVVQRLLMEELAKT